VLEKAAAFFRDIDPKCYEAEWKQMIKKVPRKLREALGKPGQLLII